MTQIPMVNDEMRAAIDDCVTRLSAHLIELVVRGPRGKTLVEIFIDAEQGVTSDLCSDVSREASMLIDRADWIQGSYRLDVSSPGITRPLRFAWQYRKHVGRTLSVRVAGPGGTVEHTGRLCSVGEHGIFLEKAKGSTPEEFPFDSLSEAIVKSPW
jgi:ribosome maturation factor RimP